MAWVVDTCLLIDIGVDDPTFAGGSVRLLSNKQRHGLIISPVTFVELAPTFLGDIRPLREFLCYLGVRNDESWTHTDTGNAHAAWWRYVSKRRTKALPKRPIADVLIGAFAIRFEGLLTRNGADFRSCFPNLRIVEP